MQEAEQQADGRGLARAIGPKEAKDLAFANVDREVIQGAYDLVPAAWGEAALAVVLGQSIGLDDGHGRRLRMVGNKCNSIATSPLLLDARRSRWRE